MLHNLLYQHTVLTKERWGQIIFCHNRLTGKINRGVWWPEHTPQWADLTFIDNVELFSFKDPVAAFEWVVTENARGK